MLFDNNAKVFHMISSLDDCKILKSILNTFSIPCIVGLFILNIGKRKVTSHREIIIFDYHLSGLPIDRVKQIIGFQ